MKKFTQQQNSGFSLIEILVATILVLILSSASYRVLTKQGRTQQDTIIVQKQNETMIRALDRFKEDVSKIDPIWPKSGVASVYPHPGFGFQKNYYINNFIRSEGLNDAVTFIHRDIEKAEIYSLASKIDNQSSETTNPNIFGGWIPLNEDPVSIDSGDMVLIYQPGKYVLGVVDAVRKSPNLIQLRELNANETQATRDNIWNRSSGFVTRPGIVPGSFDWNQKNTADVMDNAVTFDKDTAKVQVVQAVTYELDWATTDHQPRLASSSDQASGNSYILDKDGNRVKMLYRTSYANGVKTREPLGETNGLGFTYDMLASAYGGTNSFTGYTEGDIAKDIGRDTTNSIQLVNFNVDADNSNANFITTSRILSVNMFLGSELDTNQNFHSIHAALDPMLQSERYQSSAKVESAVTNNLKTQTKLSFGSVLNEQSGKPLLLVNSGENEVLLPVSTFELKSDGTMGANTDGAIYVYNPNGCAINPSTGCDPGDASKVIFNMGSNAKFFPNTITQTVLPDGSRRILIGGISMSGLNTATPSRVPGIGMITLGANESLGSKLESQDGSKNTCNISGCAWYPIDTTENAGLMDTANISMDANDPNVSYITSLTKSSGETAQSKIFKATWNGTTFTYSNLGTVNGSEDGKVVTAVSDRTITFEDGKSYFAACLSKKMSSSCNGECITDEALVEIRSQEESGETSGGSSPPSTSDADLFGQIQLISTTAGEPSIVLKDHNYRCASIAVTKDQGLLVAGRLSVQEIPYSTITATVNHSIGTGFMYLDEVAAVQNNQNIYADYFLVEPKTFANETDTQRIGWLTGLSAVEFSDGSFGMVNANKYKLAAGYDINTTGADREYANAGISTIKFAGMTDRVIASVKTDMTNLNASLVSTSYAPATSTKPGIYIPGTFYTSSDNVRNTPTPLPQLSPAMDDQSWFTMYQAMLTPNHGSLTGLDSGMPVFGSQMQPVGDCKKTFPVSCI